MTAIRKIDPLAVDAPRPDPASWPDDWRTAHGSEAMEAFRAGLCRPGTSDPRTAVLEDLSEYLGIDAEQALQRALGSKEHDATQWGDLPERPTPAQLEAFYQRNHSWVPGLLWYALLQAEGHAWPVAAMIGHDLRHDRPGAVLDFGSGVGAAGLMFHQLGWSVTFADVSSPLLDFARFRCRVRGVEADFVDLRHESLPADRFDVVAAIQTMAHVPDVGDAARRLHRSMRTFSTLFADFDVNDRTGVDSRLYDDDLPLRRATCDAGFVERRHFDWGTSIRYERVPAHGAGHVVRRVGNAARYGLPRRAYRRLRRG